MLKSWDSCLQRGISLSQKLQRVLKKQGLRDALIHLQIRAGTQENVWDFKTCLENLIYFVPFAHNLFSDFLMFPVSFHMNQSCLFRPQSPFSSVPASSVANLMANDWSISDQGSLMATYPWLSHTVCWELLPAKHTLSITSFFLTLTPLRTIFYQFKVWCDTNRPDS